MKTVMIKTHEVWLEMLMAGYISNTKNREILVNFSDILFRHFTWIEDAMIVSGEAYDYDRGAVPVKVEKLSMLLHAIITHLNELDLQLLSLSDKALSERMSSDIYYMTGVLHTMHDELVTAFSMERVYPGISLTKEATDALTLFLFEETYKEYELIMIYNYLKAHSDDAYLNRIFQILIEESFFHLKSFCEMSAKMGILAVPRVVMKELYQIEDVTQFLKDGIDEELAAKEECKRLAEAVSKDSPELEKFFDFINHQENYHIALMEDALKYYESRGADV
jgi:rubrerythrin